MKLAAFVCLLFSCVVSVGFSETAHELTSADLSAFLDGVLPLQIETEDIGGAEVVVVKDGSVLIAKGYGYSDVAKKKPVSVQDTLFRPGSVSKLFTWTAVMQLVDICIFCD
jgi:CubicO group peptidase (beta-lactamase class C family)